MARREETLCYGLTASRSVVADAAKRQRHVDLSKMRGRQWGLRVGRPSAISTIILPLELVLDSSRFLFVVMPGGRGQPLPLPHICAVVSGGSVGRLCGSQVAAVMAWHFPTLISQRVMP